MCKIPNVFEHTCNFKYCCDKFVQNSQYKGTVKIDQSRKKMPTNKTLVQCIKNVFSIFLPSLDTRVIIDEKKTQNKYLDSELNKEIMHE